MGMAIDGALKQFAHIFWGKLYASHEACILNVDEFELLADEEILYLLAQPGNVEPYKALHPFNTIFRHFDLENLFERHIPLEHDFLLFMTDQCPTSPDLWTKSFTFSQKAVVLNRTTGRAAQIEKALLLHTFSGKPKGLPESC